ncbi:tyrosine-type recombinase/integrase [Shinella zoogloeoides]|uniref:tyrosine-type recombinase/integrase n=1 Tax=Shinella zoogloeoides TaxID=352475 RepID=UPI001F5650E6|nr:site-specific integrase [Shinella zoogloeoides]
MTQSVKLTKTYIDNLQASAKDAMSWDSELKGFGVKVTPKGRKVFLVMHRPKGHIGAPKKYTIGTHGEWTVQQARDRAREILTESSKGNDTGAIERADRHRKSSDILNDLADTFLKKHAAQNRTHDETKRILEREMLPKHGRKSIHVITKHDILSVLESIRDRGSPIMANRALAAIRKFMNWCVSRGIIDVSPADSIAHLAKETSRDRVLTPEETKAALLTARTIGYPFGPIVELLFMTAQRRDEVTGMRWSEIDLDKALWTIPAERAKNGKVHDVHLSKCAVALIRSLPRFVLTGKSKSDLVFTTTGETPFSGFSKAKNALDAKMLQAMRKQASENDRDPDQISIPPWRLHDIRRTVATELSKLGIAIHVAEAILNHKSGTISGVTAVYQRNQFTAERRDALDKWCDRLDMITLNDAANGVDNGPQYNNMMAQ